MTFFTIVYSQSFHQLFCGKINEVFLQFKPIAAKQLFFSESNLNWKGPKNQTKYNEVNTACINVPKFLLQIKTLSPIKPLHVYLLLFRPIDESKGAHDHFTLLMKIIL